MKIEELVPIELNGQRLVTNKQLADFYGVTPTRIKDNFRKSKKHFVEGVHYFKISGEELKALKAQLSEIIMGDVSENFRHVYDPATVKSVFSASNTLVLYTERGAAMHCKSLRTDKAWEVHAELVRGYFDSAAESPAETPINTPTDRAELEELRAEVEGLKNTFEAWLAQMEKQPLERADKLIEVAEKISAPELRDKAYCKIFNLLVGKNFF